MRKIVSFVFLFLLISYLPCSAFAVTQQEYDEVVLQRDTLYNQLIDAGIEPKISIEIGKKEETIVTKSDSEYEVTNIYEFQPKFSTLHYVALVLKNTSGKTMQFDIEIYFMDKNDKILNVKKENIWALADQYDTACIFDTDTDYHHFSYKILPKESMYKEVNTYIEITYQISDSRVITFAVNTGSITPYAVDYTLLYFNGDKVVDYDKQVVGFTTKLNPGETQINEESTHSDFDNVVIYQKGYASKW